MLKKYPVIAWVLLGIQAILFLVPPAWALRTEQRRSSPVGLEELTAAVKTGLEEWAPSVDADRWTKATDPTQALIQSFSGIRATAGEPVILPVIQPLPDTELSAEHKLIFARYGYLFGLHQMKKFPAQKRFLFTLARDPRPSGRAVIEAQTRGILVAARELGKEVEFRDGGILPTPFAEGLARMRHSGRASDGGVISTASHNPLIWNGVKYPTAAAEPNNALVQAGILLPAREMSGVVAEAKQWMTAVTQRLESADSFRAALNEVSLRGTVQAVDPDEVLSHMVQEARRMWGLGQPNDFEVFRRQAANVRIVLDPNGGAATGHYRRFLEAFGFTVIEINNTVGQPHHGLEPINEEPDGLDHLRDAKAALAQHDADFAVVFDYDADRGNTLIRNRQTGEIIEPRPQEVAALNVAMSLAHRKLMRLVTKDTRPLAVVVHDATSRRIWEIARVYDAEVHRVEVGEVNVLEKMRDLERQGYDVAIGIEGANGGTVFRGFDPDFQGDTSRNGAMTALFTGLLMIQPQIGQEWLLATLKQRGVAAAATETPSLLDLVNALPGERGKRAWHFETPIVKQGKAGDVPEGLVVPFKQSMGTLWYGHFWPILRDQGIFLGDGTRQTFSNFRIIHHAEAAESPAYGPEDPPDAGLTEYGQGGWILELYTPEGNRAFLWFRGSLTEGLLRVSTEGQGDQAAAVSRTLLELFRLDQFPSILSSVKAGTQPILGRPLPADQRTLSTLPVSGRFRAALGSVMAEYGPGGLGMAPDNYGDLVEYWMTPAPIKLAKWAGQEWVLFSPRNQIGQLGVAPTPARRELLAAVQEEKLDLNAVVYALWSQIPDRQPIKEVLRPRVEAFVENPHSRGLVQTGLEEKAYNEDDTVDWDPEGVGVPDLTTVDSMIRDWLRQRSNPPTISEREYQIFVRSHALPEDKARTTMFLLGYGFTLPPNATIRRGEGTWVRMLGSGLEETSFEVQVPEKINELLVVLTPEMVEAGIRILNAVRITGSRGVKIAAIVWDQAQARRVSELLTENTRVNLVDIYNLKEKEIDLPEAIRKIRGGSFEGINRIFVVHTPMDFRALGTELEIPGISVRGWELWLERQLSSDV